MKIHLRSGTRRVHAACSDAITDRARLSDTMDRVTCSRCLRFFKMLAQAHAARRDA